MPRRVGKQTCLRASILEDSISSGGDQTKHNNINRVDARISPLILSLKSLSAHSSSLSPYSPSLNTLTFLPCITSLLRRLVLSVALPLRLLALYWLAVPTRKSSSPTRLARASSMALTCLQTLSVLRLGRKVRLLLVAPVVTSWFADVSCIGRNVIIEQSFGGPKITKGKSLFLSARCTCCFSVLFGSHFLDRSMRTFSELTCITFFVLSFVLYIALSCSFFMAI